MVLLINVFFFSFNMKEMESVSMSLIVIVSLLPIISTYDRYRLLSQLLKNSKHQVFRRDKKNCRFK